MILNEEQWNELVGCLQQASTSWRIYLFGAQTKGIVPEGSDLDVPVFEPAEVRDYQRQCSEVRESLIRRLRSNGSL